MGASGRLPKSAGDCSPCWELTALCQELRRLLSSWSLYLLFGVSVPFFSLSCCLRFRAYWLNTGKCVLNSEQSRLARCQPSDGADVFTGSRGSAGRGSRLKL